VNLGLNDRGGGGGGGGGGQHALPNAASGGSNAQEWQNSAKYPETQFINLDLAAQALTERFFEGAKCCMGVI